MNIKVKANPIDMIFKKQENELYRRMADTEVIQKIIRLVNNKHKNGIKLVEKNKKKKKILDAS